MLGTLGAIVFEVSDTHILTFKDLSFTRSAAYAEHKIIGRNGLVEFTGLNAATCSLTVIFDEALGVDPKEQITELQRMFSEHEANSFVLDGEPVGTGYWVIDSINETHELTDNAGRPRRITANISMKEYHEA